MFKQHCPHCGAKLGNFLYADACPHCGEILKHNQADPTPIRHKVARAKPWPVRAFFGFMRFVES